MATRKAATRVRGEEFIQKVFDSAAAEMARLGHQDISIEEVAARAGVNKTSIYRRWVTPERLVLDTFERGAETNHDPPDTGSLRQDLAIHLASFERISREPVTLAIVRMFAAGAIRGELTHVAERLGARTRLDLTRMFERAIERGELPRGTRPELGSELVHALAVDLALHERPAGTAPDEGRIADLVEVVVLGLANLALRDAGKR